MSFYFLGAKVGQLKSLRAGNQNDRAEGRSYWDLGGERIGGGGGGDENVKT